MVAQPCATSLPFPAGPNIHVGLELKLLLGGNRGWDSHFGGLAEADVGGHNAANALHIDLNRGISAGFLADPGELRKRGDHVMGCGAGLTDNRGKRAVIGDENGRSVGRGRDGEDIVEFCAQRHNLECQNLAGFCMGRFDEEFLFGGERKLPRKFPVRAIAFDSQRIDRRFVLETQNREFLRWNSIERGGFEEQIELGIVLNHVLRRNDDNARGVEALNRNGERQHDRLQRVFDRHYTQKPNPNALIAGRRTFISFKSSSSKRSSIEAPPSITDSCAVIRSELT